MKKLKQWLVDKWSTAVEFCHELVGKHAAKNKGWISAVGFWLLMAVVAIGLVAVFAAGTVLVIGLAVLIPGLILGSILWLVWTYLGIGSTYFASLDPIWLNIPYWHFVFVSGAFVFLLKLFRPKKEQPANIKVSPVSVKTRNT